MHRHRLVATQHVAWSASLRLQVWPVAAEGYTFLASADVMPGCVAEPGRQGKGDHDQH